MESDTSSQQQLYFQPKLWSHRYGEGIFTCKILEGRVVDSVAFYKIQICWGSNKNTVERRYSEFHSLMSTLVKEQVATVDNQVEFPPKTWLKHINPDFIETRRAGLETWLNETLSSSLNKEVCSHSSLRTFLELVPIVA